MIKGKGKIGVIIIALILMLAIITFLYVVNSPGYHGSPSLDNLNVYLDGGYQFDLRDDLNLSSSLSFLM